MPPYFVCQGDRCNSQIAQTIEDESARRLSQARYMVEAHEGQGKIVLDPTLG
jgi:hypothetical protein